MEYEGAGNAINIQIQTTSTLHDGVSAKIPLGCGDVPLRGVREGGPRTGTSHTAVQSWRMIALRWVHHGNLCRWFFHLSSIMDHGSRILHHHSIVFPELLKLLSPSIPPPTITRPHSFTLEPCLVLSKSHGPITPMPRRSHTICTCRRSPISPGLL